MSNKSDEWLKNRVDFININVKGAEKKLDAESEEYFSSKENKLDALGVENPTDNAKTNSLISDIVDSESNLRAAEGGERFSEEEREKRVKELAEEDVEDLVEKHKTERAENTKKAKQSNIENFIRDKGLSGKQAKRFRDLMNSKGLINSSDPFDAFSNRFEDISGKFSKTLNADRTVALNTAKKFNTANVKTKSAIEGLQYISDTMFGSNPDGHSPEAISRLYDRSGFRDTNGLEGLLFSSYGKYFEVKKNRQRLVDMDFQEAIDDHDSFWTPYLDSTMEHIGGLFGSQGVNVDLIKDSYELSDKLGVSPMVMYRDLKYRDDVINQNISQNDFFNNPVFQQNYKLNEDGELERYSYDPVAGEFVKDDDDDDPLGEVQHLTNIGGDGKYEVGRLVNYYRDLNETEDGKEKDNIKASIRSLEDKLSTKYGFSDGDIKSISGLVVSREERNAQIKEGITKLAETNGIDPENIGEILYNPAQRIGVESAKAKDIFGNIQDPVSDISNKVLRTSARSGSICR